MDRRSFGRIALAAGLAAPELARAASGAHLRERERIEMPANNLVVVFERA